jgi:hypothetical protein
VSQVENVRVNASQRLFEFRKIEGFGSLLCVRIDLYSFTAFKNCFGYQVLTCCRQSIISAKGQVDEQVRESAAINLKNLIQQHWNPRRPINSGMFVLLPVFTFVAHLPNYQHEYYMSMID